MWNNESNSIPSSKAFRLFKGVVCKDSKSSIKVRTDIGLTDAYSTWWAITAIETYAFGIDPSLIVSLCWAHTRYTDMIGQTSVAFSALREEERQAYPQYFKKEDEYYMDDAIGFMNEACGLPAIQSAKWVFRFHIQHYRSSDLSKIDTVPAKWMINKYC